MFELPWIAIFVLGAPWFWLLAIVAGCMIIWALESESGAWATTVLFIFGLLVVFFGPGVEWMKWVASNPWTILWCILGYIALGGVWGVIKWYFYSSSKTDEFEDYKIAWLRSKGIKDKRKVPKHLENEWTTYVCDQGRWGHWEYTDDDEFSPGGGRTPPKKRKRQPVLDAPRAWNNKARITRWMAYWPFSVIWTMLDDVIKKIFRTIQRWLGDLMDKITDIVWRDVSSDFGITEEKPEESEGPEEEKSGEDLNGPPPRPNIN